jgi:hypothetical protein
MKKNIAVAAYMMPSFLWSTVNTHERQPVVETGRLSKPYVEVGVTIAGTVGAGRSMMAIFVLCFLGYFRVKR